MHLGQTARERLYAALPKPAAQRASEFVSSTEIRRLLVLTKPGSPSFSYYIEDRLRELAVPVEIRALDAKLDDLDPSGTFVILCRYVKPRQLIWLFRHRCDLSGIGLFIDDDIAAMVASKDGPLDYRAYLLGMGILPLPLLNGLLTHLWTSTEALAEALAQDGLVGSILPPRPRQEHYRSTGTRSAAKDIVRVVFHATGAHFSEHRFLIPIVVEMLARHTFLSFEVIADGAPIRWWNDLTIDPARLRICSPLPWPDYFQKTAAEHVDIALVPLLPSKTNDRRSDTKRIDVSRMQAAAIYSNCDIYRRCAMPGEIFADHSPEAWRLKIDRLASDPFLRERARAATMASMATMRAVSQPSFPGLAFHPNRYLYDK
ncbi:MULTISPECIES: hypothetical protein [unclassified Shinella]|uniref:hypothetical protein n=1 Tax=unclassified Shinella TaxID=2643062 RepID=UPI00225D2797|nr:MULTISPECIES: hypothetical protein [unclassified Shinella]MCO5153686.1 hypothetical protein [Shinella sp.]MDC7259943.1 hypothetical protein [Shinella sp. YE25]CAI0341705.1 conserved hypothetical protein [Rhizobiaceae bacterium]CAK7262021.1 Glycosyltransferase family 4 protein [Shinella sp. WSC3-e]